MIEFTSKGKKLKFLRDATQLIEIYHRWNFVIATGKTQKTNDFYITVSYT